MMPIIMLLAVVGLSISLYTYWLERKVKYEPDYKATCDLSDHVSCTKPMLSKYANIFYFSNALIGTSYYVLIALLAYFNAVHLLLLAALAGCCMSVFLGYLLYFKIKSFCILCTSLYVINFLILSFVLYNFYL